MRSGVMAAALLVWGCSGDFEGSGGPSRLVPAGASGAGSGGEMAGGGTGGGSAGNEPQGGSGALPSAGTGGTDQISGGGQGGELVAPGGSAGEPSTGGAGPESGGGGSGGSASDPQVIWEVTRTGETGSNNLVAYYRIYVAFSSPLPECAPSHFGYDDELASGYEGTRSFVLSQQECLCFTAYSDAGFAVPVEGFYANGDLLSTYPGLMDPPDTTGFEPVELRHTVRELTITPGPTNPEATRYVDETWELLGTPL